MAESLDMLVADSDRSTALDEMRQHYDSGRLTLDEFESRLAEVHAARTRGDLDHAFRQLPRNEPPASLRVRDRRWSSLALQYVLVNVVCIVVWLFSGAQSDFWPKWVLLGTLVMYLRRLGRRSWRRELPPAGGRDDNT
jgi:fatty acid desaturase